MSLKRDLTNTECSIWKSNNTINPLTKRKITINGIVFKLIKKNCEEGKKKEGKKEEGKKEQGKKEQEKKEIKECPSDKILNIKTKRCVLKTGVVGKKILEELKKKKDFIITTTSNSDNTTNTSNTDLKTYTYTNIKRFKDYEKITNIFDKSNIKNKECIFPTENPGVYKLGTSDIELYKKIGSNSKYGIIFKCRYKNKSPFFIGKIQLDNKVSLKEQVIIKQISEYAIKNKVPNLPIIYKTVKCSNMKITKSKGELLPKIIIIPFTNKIRPYTIIFNEIANGDLKSFLHNSIQTIDNNLIKNIISQIFMSLACIHSLGIIHNDSHYGNFLYHKIKKGGCFHYRINNVDYYIENIGYLWISWDYGISIKNRNHGMYLIDYYRIIAVIRRVFKELLGKEKYNSKNFKFLEHIYGMIKHPDELYVPLLRKLNMGENDFLKYLLENNYLFSKVPIGSVIGSTILTFREYKGDVLYKETDKPFYITYNSEIMV